MLRLFTPVKENCIQSAAMLLKALKVNVTGNSLQEALQSHPDYPSLLSVSDVLMAYGVESVAFKGDAAYLHEIPTPFLAQLKKDNNRDAFTVVLSVENDTVRYFNPDKYCFENISIAGFEKKWVSKVILLAEAGENPGEKDYTRRHITQLRSKIMYYAGILAIPCITLAAGLLNILQHGKSALYPCLFTGLTLMGCIVTFLLLWYELDSHNPQLAQLCNYNKKTSCQAVLQSAASRIWGIRWSAIGFTYFSGGLLTLLLTGFSNMPALFILAWLNVIAAPYILYSLYFQWRVIKQWCILCLCVQGLLAAQLFTTLAGGWHTALPPDLFAVTTVLVPAAVAFLIPALFLHLFIPAYRSAKEGRGHYTELRRLKQNAQLFDALLARQKMITEDSNGLGIVLGNPNAAHKIIKVCNPYCGPCARAHKPLEELLHENPDVQVQIIFTASNLEGDRQSAPVKHLLAIAQSGNAGAIAKALDDWYLAEQKDYAAFAKVHPVNGALHAQDHMVEAMYNWCTKTDIAFTPTIFVNNYQLPEMYSVTDLKYFLSA